MTLSIEIDVNAVARSIGAQVTRSFEAQLPDLAVREAEFLLDRWRAGASGQVYPGMTRPFYSQRYQMALMRTEPRRISGGVEIFVGNSGSVDMGRNTFDFVSMIENGRGPVDLKVALERGRGKISKTGERYLVIPFRHGSGESVHYSPNFDPTAFDWVGVNRKPESAKFGPAQRGVLRNPWNTAALGPRRTTQVQRELGRTGVMYQSTYTWQRRLREGIQRTGAAGHHQYSTYRTISAHSDPAAWVLPAMAANPIFEATVRSTEPLIRQHIEEALRAQPAQASWFRRLFGF